MKHKLYIILSVLSIILIVFIISGKNQKNNADNGVLILKSEELDSTKILPLTGEWEFYYKQFILPNNFNNNNKPDYINQKFWNKLNDELDRKAYATYRLKIIINKERPDLYIESGKVMTASKLWLNDRLIYEQGKVDSLETDTYPESYHSIYPFPLKEGVNEVVIHASNYNHRNGGMYEVPKIGSISDIYNYKERNIGFTALLIGLFFIIGIYNLIIYLINRSLKSSALIALFIGILIVRLMVMGNETVRLFIPEISWSVLFRLEYLTFFISPPVFTLFLYELFPDELNKKWINYGLYLSLTAFGISFIINTYIISFFSLFYFPVVAAYVVYIFFAIMLAIKRKRKNSIIIFTGTVVFSYTAIHDIFIVYDLIDGLHLVPFGFLILLIFLTQSSVENFISANKHNLEMTEKLKTLNTDLEKIVKQRTEKLNKANEQLFENNLQKDRFISIISHDLRNPIGGVKALTDILVQKYEKFDKNYVKEKWIKVNDTLKYIYKLTENLLSWSRIQRGKINFMPAPIQLKRIISENINLAETQAERKGIRIVNKSNENCKVFADEYMINIILSNLITNAVKFSYNNSLIEVGSEKLNDSHTKVFVKDEGAGISPENIQKIFKKDKLLNNRGTAMEKGSGLGLILCREFIEFHHSKLYVESELGKGSTFSFEIRIASDTE